MAGKGGGEEDDLGDQFDGEDDDQDSGGAVGHLVQGQLILLVDAVGEFDSET